MFRINLLPKEVLERRRYEGWYRWVFILAAGLILMILGVYVLLMFEVNSKNGQLQTIQESATHQKTLAEQLSIFQNKEQELQARQAVAQTALAGRVNIGQVAEEVSLVLPDEVWLDLLTINENTGILLTGQTPRNAGESSDVAYKSVAKTLVRLNELPDLYDVWLTTAVNGQWGQWAPSANSESSPLAVNVVTFQATSKVEKPAAAAATPAGTAPTAGTTTPAAAAQGAVNSANSAGSQ
jgi:Tfp pilus assembly protein PilN